MRWRREHLVWAMIAGGVVIRVVLAAATHGLAYDVASFRMLRTALSSAPLHFYSAVNPGATFHWPYPPGFLPLVLAVSGINDLFGGGFSHIIRLPAILADGAIAWLVWWGLAGRLSERERLLAVALVAFGPVFILVSGVAVQIDSVAILPAVGALLVWERAKPDQRAWIAGGLIGVAAAIKTVPIVAVLALAPTARSWREAATLVGCAIAVPVVAIAPFLIADESGVRRLIHYAGAPGMGGLSLVLQPNLAQNWLTRVVAPNGVTKWLFVRHAGLLNDVVIAAAAAYLLRFRCNPRRAAVLLWLVVLAFGSGFFFQYLVWGLPFFLLAGYLRATALLQAAVTAPMLLYYFNSGHHPAIVYVYVPLMLVVWVGWVLAIAALVRRDLSAWRRGRAGWRSEVAL